MAAHDVQRDTELRQERHRALCAGEQAAGQLVPSVQAMVSRLLAAHGQPEVGELIS